MPRPILHPLDLVTPDTPLRLDHAAAIAFPDGSVTGGGLRRAADAGLLQVERIQGKLFTTLADIREFRARCRVPAREPASTSASAATAASGSSSTANDKSQLARARASLEKLRRKRSPITPKEEERFAKFKRWRRIAKHRKVYVVKAGDFIKIGYSANLKSRIPSIQTGCMNELKIIAILDGSTREEAALHRRFHDLHVRGEWFKCEGPLAEWINGGCKLQ